MKLPISRFRSTWLNAFHKMFKVKSEDLLEYGLVLGRLSESYSYYSVAEDVFHRLSESANRQEDWIPDPASVLITAGEFNRRRGNLDDAEKRFREAIKLLETDLFATTQKRNSHQTLGRLFYELAYLERLRGDAGAARSRLERSEVECELAEDEVGTEIARTVLAVIHLEEGFTDLALGQLDERLARLNQLVDDAKVKEQGRIGFARRWVNNALAHHAQAHLVSGNIEVARQSLQAATGHMLRGAGFANNKYREAQLHLADDQIGAAGEAIKVAREEIDGLDVGFVNFESSAAILVISGIIHALEDSEQSLQSALACFEHACALRAELHNHRPQAWAWAGRAILAHKAGDSRACLDAIYKGLALVQRSGAPIRAFLLRQLRSSNSATHFPDFSNLKDIVCRSG